MTAYAVYEQKDARRLPLEARVEALTFVKDGFSWSAFLFSGAWLAIKGHWRALALWLTGLAVTAGLLAVLGLSADAFIWLWLAMSLIAGFEAAGLERDKLEREYCREIGWVRGSTQAECEQAAMARLRMRIDSERQYSESSDA
jgi:hypothetical protein